MEYETPSDISFLYEFQKATLEYLDGGLFCIEVRL